jgi:hypothetical protein
MPLPPQSAGFFFFRGRILLPGRGFDGSLSIVDRHGVIISIVSRARAAAIDGRPIVILVHAVERSSIPFLDEPRSEVALGLASIG